MGTRVRLVSSLARLGAVVALASGVACGGEGGAPKSPAANEGCGGGAGGEVAGACAALEDCGPTNAVRVTFCEHCFVRADTHVCEAGACRAVDSASSNVSFRFAVPPAVRGAKSFTIASVNPILASGARVDCASLLSDACTIDGNSSINARNSRFSQLPAGEVVSGLISADPGEGRLLVVQITEGAQGTGRVQARGCAATDVRSGETVGPLLLELTPIPGFTSL